jgi:geranylgeranyl diphosphate synthase type I
MRYHLGWEDSSGRPETSKGGKLLRPALCLLCCEAAGSEARRALPAAGAVELLHNFTLIHDDIEDGSTERHGRETLWRVWGEALAINAGDAMFALAHLALLQLEDEGHVEARVVRAAKMLDETTLRLAEGQHLDLAGAANDRASYLSMVEGKSAVLLGASCGLGALAAGADGATVDALYEFGRRLGLGFQIRDDILGVWGDPSETGKSAGDDLRAGKRSFPVIAALELANEARRGELETALSSADIDRALELLDALGARDECERAAREHAEAAVAALRPVELEPARKAELEQLARFASERRA